MGAILTNITEIFANSGWAQIFLVQDGWKYAVMLAVACVLLYLAIVKQFEPLLLLPIGFGMLMTNLPLDGIFHIEIFLNETNHINWEMLGNSGGLADYIYLGVKLGIYPPLIFLGIGTMTDFTPLIARPSSLLLGAAAQLGIFFTFIGARLLGFTGPEAASIGIIGGADGPTAIYTTTRLAPHLLGSIAVAAYCYMALVPVIQPPIMRFLTTEKERQVIMDTPRQVSRTEKILFPIVVTIIVSLTLPDAAILVGCLMMGNLMKESGVVERITKTAGNELMNIITIFLGLHLPHAADRGDHRPGRRRLRRGHGGRRAAGQGHVRPDPRQDQPADRFRRRVRRADGGPRQPEGRAGVQSPQLPADARHGPQRGRRHRFRRRGRYPHQHFRLIQSRFLPVMLPAGKPRRGVLRPPARVFFEQVYLFTKCSYQNHNFFAVIGYCISTGTEPQPIPGT